MVAEEVWVSLSVVAAHLDMHYQTAWSKTVAGELPGHRINGKGRWRFHLSEVDAHIKGDTQIQSNQSRGRKRAA